MKKIIVWGLLAVGAVTVAMWGYNKYLDATGADQ